MELYKQFFPNPKVLIERKTSNIIIIIIKKILWRTFRATRTINTIKDRIRTQKTSSKKKIKGSFLQLKFEIIMIYIALTSVK